MLAKELQNAGDLVMTFSEYGPLPRRFPRAMSAFLDKAARREARLIAPYLDRDFYLENNSDVAASGIDASYHYAKYGWREGRDPSPSFSTKGYLSAHPKVALEGTNPLLHFISQGEGTHTKTDEEEDRDREAEIALVEEHLDETFYASSCADYSKNGLAPAEQYCRTGWREGKDPSPSFSTSYYLLTNPDVRESGVNPFWHYLIAGREEGRLPLHPGGWRHGVLSRQTSFDAYCREWLRQDAAPELLSVGEIVDALENGRIAAGLLVSFGHDDYRATPGGVQLCVEIEARDAKAHDVDYLNLHPWQPLPKLADVQEDYILCIVLNGELIGAAIASSVTSALRKLDCDKTTSRIVIHHLAGHAPERIVEIASALGVKSALLWLHDYFTLCTSYALQRNNVTPCNVPSQSSNACQVCLFGAARRAQSDRIEKLFQSIEINLVSPSEVALEFWSKRTSVRPKSAVVHPHIQIETRVKARPEKPADQPVRIAFIGTPAAHKGWPEFRELERRLAANEAYEFCCFGNDDPGLNGITHYETHVRATDPESTMRAVKANRIDLVLHWASWPETFSFSTFEAMGGGAFVITNRGSGNVAAAVEANGRGIILDSTDALYELAMSGGLKSLAIRSRERRGRENIEVQFSGMSHDLENSEVMG